MSVNNIICLKEHINLEFVKMIKVLISNQFLVFFGMVDRNFCCIIVREAVKLGVFFLFCYPFFYPFERQSQK